MVAILKLTLVYLTGFNGSSGVVEAQTVEKGTCISLFDSSVYGHLAFFLSIVTSFLLIIDENNRYTLN